jgi:hypothetical protein
MTWKRTIAIIASLIWIAICAASVFAQDLVAAPSRIDIRTVSAQVFDDIHLEELLKIDIAADASIFVNPTTITNTINASDTVYNVYPSADFMHEMDASKCAKTITVPEQSPKKSEMAIQTSSSLQSLRPTNIRISAGSSTIHSRNVRALPTSTK